MRILWWIATAAPLLAGVVLLSVNIRKPFIGQHDWNGVVYGQEAKNFVRYGYLPLRFGATISAGTKPIEELKFSTHYTSALPILISFSYRLFGVSEWSTRLLPILASISSLFLIMLLGTELVSWRAGMIAGILAVVTPMFIYYGKNPVHEVVQLPFSLLAFYAYLKWRRTSMNTWLFLIIGSLTITMLVGWPGYYATGLIAIHGFFFVTPPSRQAAGLSGAGVRQRRAWLFLPLLAVGLFVFYIWHTQLVAPGSIAKIGTAAVSRIGSSGFPLAEWVQRELRYSTNLFTGTLLALSGLWVLGTLWRVARKRINDDDVLLGFLGLYGVAHVVLFRDASWYHEYLLFPLLPFLAITSAIVLTIAAEKIKSFGGRMIIIAAVLVMVSWERAGYARALLRSEYVRDVYEEANEFAANARQRKDVRIPEERDVFFVFYADRLD